MADALAKELVTTCRPFDAARAAAIGHRVDEDKPLAPMIPDQVRDRAGPNDCNGYSPSISRPVRIVEET